MPCRAPFEPYSVPTCTKTVHFAQNQNLTQLLHDDPYRTAVERHSKKHHKYPRIRECDWVAERLPYDVIDQAYGYDYEGGLIDIPYSSPLAEYINKIALQSAQDGRHENYTEAEWRHNKEFLRKEREQCLKLTTPKEGGRLVTYDEKKKKRKKKKGGEEKALKRSKSVIDKMLRN